jgi:hypothetical protein
MRVQILSKQLSSITHVVIYTKCIIHISSNYNSNSKLLTLTFLFDFLPFFLQILFLRFTSLENNSNGENDHPNNHPRDIYSEILAQVVLSSEDYRL